ncbi:hypothetical protein [Algoriphagus aquimarinus]|uniref:hypothetical protein n=1 Tax=Algoriphagus aquimarinus TaxID=237018 RepID=UPI0030DD83B8|tara:strand:- start:343830 stop:344117 length:288 start_codon:yes stop_codon:yes gene_type:complete
MKKEKLKSDIYSMIADVESEEWLEEIKTFLANKAAYQKRLVSAAQAGENDIINGRLMSLEEIKSRLYDKMKKRSDDVSNGNFISHEDLEKESKNW